MLLCTNAFDSVRASAPLSLPKVGIDFLPDPFAPSSDPDIPTPTRSDLLNLVHGSVRDQLAAGALDAKHAENEWAGARRQWDEGHKRDAERRREEAKPDQKIGLPLAGGAIPPNVDSGFPGTFGDIKPPNDSTTGTRVIGQTANESDHERRQRERKQIESKVVGTMHRSHREKYENPNTPEHQRRAIFQTYKDKMDESQRREDVQFQKRLEKIVGAQDWLQRIKDDPTKAHLPRPADDSEEELLKWYDEMSKPKRLVPFPGSIDADTQSYNRPDLRQLQSEVDRATKVMGEAAKILRTKSTSDVSHTPAAPEPHPQPATVAPKEKVSWIHRIPVWKEFGHWLKWATACFGFTLGMTQVNEYGWAMLGLVGCGVCCLAQLYVWTASPNWFKNKMAKVFLALLSLAMITIAGLTVVRIKANRPWSNLFMRDGQGTQIPQPPPSVLHSPTPTPESPFPTADLRNELRADGNRALRLVTIRLRLKRQYSIDEIGHFRIMYEVASVTDKITPEFYLACQDYYDVNTFVDPKTKQFGYRWAVRYRKSNDNYKSIGTFNKGRGYGATIGLVPATDVLEASADLYNQIPSDKTLEDLYGKYLYIFVTESLVDKISGVSLQVNNWELFSVKADRLIFQNDKPIAPWFIALSKEERAIPWRSVDVRYDEPLPPAIATRFKGQGIGWTWVGSSRVDLQACKLEYSIVSPK